jgi:glucose/arabinose dehydrogenase
MRAGCLAALLLASCGGGAGVTPAPGASAAPGGACSAGTPVPGSPALAAVRVLSGLDSPVDLQVPRGDRERMFVVEQGGLIRIARGGSLLPKPFLDLRGRISSGGERGLLGLAFHPDYARVPRFYVNYTDEAGDTHISEFRASSDPDVALPSSERQLLFVPQPFPNHNGGGLTFGNDGMLYAGLGDGGSGGDPQGNGQNLGTPLGKMLRLDVDRGAPADNPFVGRAGARPEIWAYGLRNPWRFAFDRQTGDLYIGDVGQSQVEEVDVGLASRKGGENYGWNVTEGSRCFRPASGCSMAGITLPVTEYSHNDGCSISGGVVYRGCRMPGYAGTYFYSDFCTAFLRSFRLQNGQAAETRDWTQTLGTRFQSVSAFGVDDSGEVYVLDYGAGAVYRLEPR